MTKGVVVISDEHTSINEAVNAQLQYMFSVFNDKFFEGKLEMPLFRLQNSGITGSFNNNAVLVCDGKYSHEIIIPVALLNDRIDVLTECLLHNMIHYYDFLYGLNLSSNNDSYHNKKFKNIAENCLLRCKYNKIHGWCTETSNEFMDFCERYGFKKTWNTRYIKYVGAENAHHKKYVCPMCHNSFRATKLINAVCADCNKKFIIYNRDY